VKDLTPAATSRIWPRCSKAQDNNLLKRLYRTKPAELQAAKHSIVNSALPLQQTDKSAEPRSAALLFTEPDKIITTTLESSLLNLLNAILLPFVRFFPVQK